MIRKLDNMGLMEIRVTCFLFVYWEESDQGDKLLN